ncbi:two-component system response regulator YesN [Planomicrobium stackebrandtii]|uniref:Two-component system response regulator YesN n=1 Tax=Planomicrobium stackebrandtii TaxID=253160 RepID=A0ABU0GT71_9BACL|nr:response regulator transcription factor [Planomicrobium stackebrandtii]MDQ0428503.1 two-component system response regulator YesN [Planomicrobium stackebrandtii]
MGEACKVLIVDDEMLIRQGIINYIDWEQEGFQIVGEASNGKEALQLIAEFSPHIVVTDIVMPIMDGIDLVREGKKAFPDTEFIVLSSFENFDYVRSTFQNGVADYILKPKLNGPELLKILNRVVSRIPDLQHCVSAVKPERSTEEILENMILGYDFSLDQTVLANALPNSGFALLDVQGKNLDPFQLKAGLQRLSLKELPVFALNSSETETVILLNFNRDQLDNIKRTIEQQAAETSDAAWMLFEPFDAIDDIKRVHDEGRMKMKKYMFYLPDANLFSYDNLPEENEKQDNFDLNHFIELFKDRLFNAAFTYLEDHVDYLAGRYNNDSFEFKSFLGNIVFNVIVLLDAMKYDTQELEEKKYGYFSAINEAKHAKEAFDQFNEFLEEVRTIMLVGDKANESNNLDKILGYIEQHYTEPLRLSEIANHFHFNASYLSSYFSTHHKEGFSEYLNRVRIKKSMELLENSTVSISNISGMVGYSEHSYFCKVFKRITGMSPGSYRKELQARHENEEKGLSSLKK